MTVREPLLRRLVVLVSGVVAALSIGAFVITASVTRSGLEDLFRQRFDQAARVLEEHAQSRMATRYTELESVLASPRFLAAVETFDPATIADAVPTHAVLAEAELVVLMGSASEVLFRSADASDDIMRRLPELRAGVGRETMSWIRASDVLDILVVPLVANNGARLGTLAVGERIDTAYAEELQALTGFDVLVSRDQDVVTHTPGLTASAAEAVASRDVAGAEVVELSLPAGETMVYRALDASTGLTVTFVGSVHEAIAPIMSRMQRLLLLLAAAGAVLAVGFAHSFMKRRVARPVERLAQSAERIARGDLEFVISAESEDEFGYVAGEFEKMRAQLRSGRDALEVAHAQRVNSERLAALGKMATGIIHDLKNPMGVVQGTADLIRMRDPENLKLAKQCDVIAAQIDRMSALARDVLEYARGRTVLEPVALNLGVWLREIADGQEEAYRRSGVRLVVGDSSRVNVMIDPGRMRRVIDNLLTNAREVSRVGDAVTVSVQAVAAGGVILEVLDEGPGVPEEIRAALFEPFVTAGKDGGSGLGLAISKKIVEDHGATISVQSERGAGSRFQVVLPAKLVIAGQTVREEAAAT